jgi:U3 small nucleolar RNA-associated protein 3
MGKKRKAGGRPAQKDDVPMRTKYSIEERFEDSEDEFQAQRDQILLEEAPEAKRRRRVTEDGMIIVELRVR